MQLQNIFISFNECEFGQCGLAMYYHSGKKLNWASIQLLHWVYALSDCMSISFFALFMDFEFFAILFATTKLNVKIYSEMASTKTLYSFWMRVIDLLSTNARCSTSVVLGQYIIIHQALYRHLIIPPSARLAIHRRNV